MVTITLTPESDNGNYFYTTTAFSGSGYTDSVLSVEFPTSKETKIWLEISTDETEWFIIPESQRNVVKKDIFPLVNPNILLKYRVCSLDNATSIKFMY